jgi:hypothetical protein
VISLATLTFPMREQLPPAFRAETKLPGKKRKEIKNIVVTKIREFVDNLTF